MLLNIRINLNISDNHILKSTVQCLRVTVIIASVPNDFLSPFGRDILDRNFILFLLLHVIFINVPTYNYTIERIL